MQKKTQATLHYEKACELHGYLVAVHRQVYDFGTYAPENMQGHIQSILTLLDRAQKHIVKMEDIAHKEMEKGC